MRAERAVVFQVREQAGKTRGHVEIQRWRDLAQIGKRLFQAAGPRRAGVDMHRAATRKRGVDVVVGAEHVRPGQPVDQHRIALVQKRPELERHLQVAGHHAVGIDHRLRLSGGAGGEQDFRGRRACDRRQTGGRGFRCEQFLRGNHGHAARRQHRECVLILRGIVHQHRRGIHQIRDFRDLRVAGRRERVLRCHRRDRDGGCHRAEQEARMRKPVGREDEQGPGGRVAAREQTGAGRLRIAPRIGVAPVPPLARGVTFCHEGAIGRLVRPARHPHQQVFVGRGEGLARAQQHRAVGPALHLDIGRRKKRHERRHRLRPGVRGVHGTPLTRARASAARASAASPACPRASRRNRRAH